MLRNEMRVDPQAHSAQIDHRVRDRRALPLRRDHHHAGRASTSRWSRRYLRYQENEPFNATELLRTQFALDDSQYFSTVEVLPEDRDRENHIVPVSIAAEPNRRHRYPVRRRLRHRHAGARHGRLGRPARESRAVIASARKSKAAALAQSIDARYIVPIGDPATEKFTLQLTGEHERRADIDDQTINFIAEHHARARLLVRHTTGSA